jgi:hypothetical protein
MATFRMSRTQTIIAQFRDFDHRFLAIGQLHGTYSLASSKLNREQGGRRTPRTAACHRRAGRADALVTRSRRQRIGSDSELCAALPFG